MHQPDNQDHTPMGALREELKAALEESQKSHIPLFIAFLAALLAIVSMADDEADKRARTAHLEAANQYAYFQSKNIRLTDSEIAAKLFARLGAEELGRQWREKAVRYDGEKAEILADARKQDNIRRTADLKGENYKVGVALLQIAIVLASASLVMGGGYLLGFSFVLTLISIVYAINGVGLYTALPTDPAIMFNGVGGIVQQILHGPAAATG